MSHILGQHPAPFMRLITYTGPTPAIYETDITKNICGVKVEKIKDLHELLENDKDK